jgi:predicted alternative tryptophan synthase beta-subunit
MHSWKDMLDLLEEVDMPKTVGFQADLAHTYLYLLGCNAPEHALLKATGRVCYVRATDTEALEAVHECCSAEGILPALESAHALVGARNWARENPGKRIVIGLSGRGDKDQPTLSQQSSDTNDTVEQPRSLSVP